MWAVLAISFAANVWGIQILPALQLVGGIMHVAFFVALVVPLVLLAPRSTPDFVFGTLLNEGGWKSDGISWCLGMLTVTYCFLGELFQGPMPGNPFLTGDDAKRLRWRHSHERGGSQPGTGRSSDSHPVHRDQRRPRIRLHVGSAFLHRKCEGRVGIALRLPHHRDLLPGDQVHESDQCHAKLHHGHWLRFQYRCRRVCVPSHLGLCA